MLCEMNFLEDELLRIYFFVIYVAIKVLVHDTRQYFLQTWQTRNWMVISNFRKVTRFKCKGYFRDLQGIRKCACLQR